MLQPVHDHASRAAVSSTPGDHDDLRPETEGSLRSVPESGQPRDVGDQHLVPLEDAMSSMVYGGTASAVSVEPSMPGGPDIA